MSAGPGSRATAFLVALGTIGVAVSPVLGDSSRPSASTKAGLESAALLADYYEAFLRDQDLEAFRRGVTTRFNEDALRRLLRGGSPVTRRACVLGLGLIGSMKSNATVGEGLRDPDPMVRSLAAGALWGIWFRAGSPEQNERLTAIREQIARGDLRAAEALATRLIEVAPDFAEAYNQRAIAVCFQGRFADSVNDCLKVLELNPYHVGALDGLAQCYLALGERREAIKTYQRALALQPYSDRLRELIARIEEADD